MRSVFSSALKVLAASVTAALLAGACADSAALPPPNFATSDAEVLSRTYRLGVGDKLKLTVFGEPNLSGPAEVNALGNVSVPLIGEVPAKGRAISEFKRDVTRRLSQGYLKQPKITVDVLNYRPFYVHGEVKSGGEFPYRTALRMRDAVATAGGYTYRADKAFVILQREGYPEYRIKMSSNMPVLPGDNIRIPERFF
jgi:protein involved in polysaccharide export with SLBB domain